MGDTHRLYYTDSRLTEFTTRVVAVKPAEGRTAIRLEQTAFYPTSGGQPHDTGWIEDQPVVDVVDGEDGSVWHVVAGSPTLAVGETVAGRIDWPRRFDHMQQHTGQHILSAELARLLGAQTVGFISGWRPRPSISTGRCHPRTWRWPNWPRTPWCGTIGRSMSGSSPPKRPCGSSSAIRHGVPVDSGWSRLPGVICPPAAARTLRGPERSVSLG